MAPLHRKSGDGKLLVDLTWNYGALAVLAISGILINFIAAGAYGAAGLGVFTQTYAIYVVASQFAVAGLHHSALKHVAEFAGEDRRCGAIALSALLLAALTGGAAAAVVTLAAGALGDLFASDGVAETLRYAAAGLFFFALNKVNFSVLNGLRLMRAYALGQSLRCVLMVGVVVWAATAEMPVAVLGATFTVSEAVLAAGLTPYVWRRVGPGLAGVGPWLRRHARFGAKGALSGLLVEANLRIDVLMLGLFAGDQVVGMYGLASTLAEGFYNVLVVLRTNVNPLLVGWVKARRFAELAAFVHRTQVVVYPLAAALAGVLVVAFPFAVPLISSDPAFAGSWLVLAILCAGMVAYSGFVPFDFIFLQAGAPETHTLFMSAAVIANVILNAMLIPLLGAPGAALATAAALALTAALLTAMARRRFGVNLCGGAR